MPGPGLYRALFVLRGNLPAGGFCAPHAAWALGRNGKKLAASGKTLAASWRSGWDSNPRAVSCKLISSQPRYDHFDTAAQCITLYLCGGEKSSVVCVFGPPGGPAAISDVCGCARAVNGAAPGFGPAPVLPEVYKVFYRIFRFWVFHFVKQHSIIPYVRPAIRMRTADRN